MYAVSPSIWIIGLSKTLFASILSGKVTSQINRAHCLMDWNLILDLDITMKISNCPHYLSFFPTNNGVSGLLTFRWMLNGPFSYILKRRSLTFPFLLLLKPSSRSSFPLFVPSFPRCCASDSTC
jgi:hypothetical protein